MMVRTTALGLGLGLLAVACATAGSRPGDVSFIDDDASSSAQRPDVSFESSPGSDANVSTDTGAATCDTPCGLSPQCGCLADQTCDLDDTGARSCVSGGTIKAGVPCLSTRECSTGLVCAQGVCRAPCSSVGDACTGERAGACGEYAKATADGGASSVVYTACAVTCAYDKEDSCGFAKGDLLAAACVYQAASNTVECQRVRNVQLQSGLCATDAECGAGRICVAGPDFSSCRRLCKVGDITACGGCKAIAPPRIIDGTTYGACP